MATKKRVFFFEGNRDGTVGGSYFLMYDLVLGLDKGKFEPVVGFYNDNFLVEKLRSAGVKTVVFGSPPVFEFKRRFLNSLLMPVKKLANFYHQLVAPTIRFRRFLIAEKIDLVNANNSIRSNHPWMIAAKLLRIPCITHEMGINESFTGMAKYLGKRLDAIICLSYAIHDTMQDAGAGFANRHVVHCGIDLHRYQVVESPNELRRKYAIPEGAPIIGVVGNVKPWKGQKTIVSAMPTLVKKYPTLRCILVGDMPDYARQYHEELRGIIKSNQLEDNVIFAGFQKNSIDFMNLMDIVVHTSVDPEPFGIVTLEAMSVKKPLISTTIGGPAEVVESGKSGYLIPPGDPNVLADTVDLLLSDQKHAKEIGEAGFENLVSNFTFEKSLKKTMKIYDEVLSR